MEVITTITTVFTSNYFLFFALSIVIALAGVTTYLAVRSRALRKSKVD